MGLLSRDWKSVGCLPPGSVVVVPRKTVRLTSEGIVYDRVAPNTVYPTPEFNINWWMSETKRNSQRRRTMEQEIRDRFFKEASVYVGYSSLKAAVRDQKCMDIIKPILFTLKECNRGTKDLKEVICRCEFSNEKLTYLREHLGEELSEWLGIRVESTNRELYKTVKAHISWHLRLDARGKGDVPDLNHLITADIEPLKRGGELPV